MAESIGPYQIRGELGRGAMAVVWRAFDPSLGREVAIKEPVFPHGLDPVTREELVVRFIREGRTAGQLNHPGIVTIHAADVYDGRPAIVMELIEGETLCLLLRRSGRLPLGAAIGIAEQLLGSLAYAHARGVVHRDIKPDNVFVTDDGRVKLADFGIAHVGAGTALTQAGTVMGTPGYMAPEQVRGEAVDARADLFSVGVMLYEMLTGGNPFVSGDAHPTAIMYRVLNEQLRDVRSALPDASEGLAATVAIATAKEAETRFASAEQMRRALLGEVAVAMPRAPRAESGRRGGVVAVVAVVATLMVAGLLAWTFWPEGVGNVDAADPIPIAVDVPEEPARSAIKAAMVTDTGGLGDKSFNDLSNAGLERARDELGVEIRVLESRGITDYESNIVQLANEGFSPIFAVGFLMTDAVGKMAPQYADVQFGGVDQFFEPVPENVAVLVFKEEEGSYLAGVVAGLATKDSFDSKLNADNVIGFVGGMDIPLIKKYEAGFIAGAKSVNPNVQVISLYAGNFTDQATGKELGFSLIEQKADVIYAAAGAVGLGTIEACKERGALFIGADSDQFETVPGSGDVMLTSVVKRVDNAVFETIKAAVAGDFFGGEIHAFGLAEGGVELAPFHVFEAKVPQAIKDAVERAGQGVIDGSVTVPTTP